MYVDFEFYYCLFCALSGTDHHLQVAFPSVVAASQNIPASTKYGYLCKLQLYRRGFISKLLPFWYIHPSVYFFSNSGEMEVPSHKSHRTIQINMFIVGVFLYVSER